MTKLEKLLFERQEVWVEIKKWQKVRKGINNNISQIRHRNKLKTNEKKETI